MPVSVETEPPPRLKSPCQSAFALRVGIVFLLRGSDYVIALYG